MGRTLEVANMLLLVVRLWLQPSNDCPKSFQGESMIKSIYLACDGHGAKLSIVS